MVKSMKKDTSVQVYNSGSAGDKFFYIILIVFLVFAGVLCILPFLNVIAKSFSKEAYVMARRVNLLPKGFNFQSYLYVLNNIGFVRSFIISVGLTICGTFFSMFLTVISAYPLSKQYLPGRRIILFLYVFTMMFTGGIIPTFLVIKILGMTNSLLGIVIPFSINIFNLVILKNFFISVPDSLEESALIDGASHYTILFKIYLQLSLPAIATVSLFYAIHYWNSYFWTMILISDRKIYTLPLYLRELILDEGVNLSEMDVLADVAPVSVRSATIILATIPILLLYPFAQKYFVKGIMVGSVKG